MGFAAPFIPAIVGAGAGAMAKGAVAGGLMASLGPTTVGALAAGGTSLLMGNDPLTAGLDALGGAGIGGAVDDLAKAGAVKAAGVTGSGVAGIPLSPEFLASTTGGGAGVANVLENAGAGLGGLFQKGANVPFEGATNFQGITGNSALSSVGLPAAGLAMQAMSPPPGAYGLAPDPYAESFGPFTPISELRRRNESMGYAQGGIAELNPMHGMFDARNGMTEYGEPQTRYKKGGYLNGPGDGMSDDIPATIEGKQPARLADGEFVVPADVVSHLGNGSTKAGAQRLYSMMSKVRKARTGNSKQGKQIKAEKYMPA